MSHETNALTAIEQLIALLDTPDFGLTRLRRLVGNGELAAWLDSRSGLSEPLRRRIAELFRVLSNDPARLLFALRFTLTPEAPLELAPDLAIRQPDDIAHLLAAHSDRRDALIAGLCNLIDTGRLSEWLRACEFDGWQRLLRQIEDIHAAYPNEPELPGYAMAWRYAPELPLPFGTEAIADPRQLARCIDASEVERRRGEDLLARGWLRTWLVASGRLRDPAPLDAILERADLSVAARLEGTLHLLDPDLPWPDVVFEPSELDLGTIPEGDVAEGAFELCNGGRGHAWGSLRLATDTDALSVAPASFEGQQARFTVTVRADRARRGRSQQAEIRYTGNGTQATLPVTWRVGMTRRQRGQRIAGAVIGLTLLALVAWLWIARPAFLFPPAPVAFLGLVSQENGRTFIVPKAFALSNGGFATADPSIWAHDPSAQHRETRRRELQAQLGAFKRLWLYHDGELVGTFEPGRLVPMDYEPWGLDGRVQWRRRPEDHLSVLAVSHQGPQSFLLPPDRLSPQQRREFDAALQSAVADARRLVSGQRPTGSAPEESDIKLMDLDGDRAPEAYARQMWAGSPCGYTVASVLLAWTQNRPRPLRSATNLLYCPDAESVGAPWFELVPIDVDADGLPELLLTEHFYESWSQFLYRYRNGRLEKLVDIGDGGV